MNVVIIEDEKQSSMRLERMLKSIDNEINICAKLESVEETIKFFSEPNTIDLVFMDIQLSDGISFDVFEEIEIKNPIIFTTSYDEYALKAFDVNSIDYLLKPIQPEMLEKSLNKYKRLCGSKEYIQQNIPEVIKQFAKPGNNYKTRFLVKHGGSLISITTNNIAFFFVEDTIYFIQTTDNKRYIVNNTMEVLETMLDPKVFFRINRQIIIHIDIIDCIHPYFNGALKLSIKIPTDKELIVSRLAVKEFKEWMNY